MSYTLSFAVQPEYLEVDLQVHVAVGGALRDALSRWKEVARLCREHARNKVLVQMTFEGNHSLETKFQLAKGAPAIGWGQDLKLAVVISDPVQLEGQRFTEAAMLQMGYEIQLFAKKKAAKKWLLG